MKPAEFYDLTWNEYQRACLGYRIRLDRKWDIARNIIVAQANSMGAKLKAGDIYKCIFDKAIEPAYETPENWDKIKKAFKLN